MATKTIMYSRKEGNTGYNRQDSYDTEYGTTKKSVLTDYRLGLLNENANEGHIITYDALAELRQPKWGPNADMPFSELIPELRKLPAQFIPVPEYFWVAYDVSSGKVPTEIGTEYECGLKVSSTSWRIISLVFDGTYDIFNVLFSYGFFTHFRKRNLTGRPVNEVNPEYAPALEKLNAEKAEYEKLLRETMILTASHVFPAYPLNDVLLANLMSKYGLTAEEIKTQHPEWLWSWYELIDNNWTKIPVDPAHRLASASGGWKQIRRPIKFGTEVGNPWAAAVNNACDYSTYVFTPDQKLKRTLGIMN